MAAQAAAFPAAFHLPVLVWSRRFPRTIRHDSSLDAISPIEILLNPEKTIADLGFRQKRNAPIEA
jgi:hypothetical protein